MVRGAARQTRKAFTLVELLVVIGIIAVLISILLPSLARARDAALTVSCQANLRQIGQALVLYADSNRGLLPHSEVQGATEAGNWWYAVTETLGGSFGTPGNESVSPVLRCPGAIVAPGTVAWWRPNYQSHYIGNPRMMPPGTTDATNWWDRDGANGVSRDPMRRTLASVNDTASKALVWDGPQITGLWMNNNAFIWSLPMDGWGWYGGHRFCDPADDGSSLDGQIATGFGNRDWSGNDAVQNRLNKQYNHDSEGNFDSFIRFRHASETTANILFCDGHVEGVQIGGIPRKMFCVSFR